MEVREFNVSNLIERAEASLEKLRTKPKILLLTLLCRYCMVYDPKEAEKYFNRMQKESIPKEFKEAVSDLKAKFEKPSDTPDNLKGFALEKIEEIKTIVSDQKITTQQLQEALTSFETKLKKRWMPYDKDAVYTKLFHCWVDVDRKYALGLCNTISQQKTDVLLMDEYKKRQFDSEEWDVINSAIPSFRVVEFVLKLMDNSSSKFDLPNNIVPYVVEKIIENLNTRTLSSDETAESRRQEVDKAVEKLHKFLVYAAKPGNVGILNDLYKNVVTNLVSISALDASWTEHFHILDKLIRVGISLGLITLETCEKYRETIPKQYKDFFLSRVYGLTADETIVGDLLKDLDNKSLSQKNSEAMFYVTLIERGKGELVCNLIDGREATPDLIGRIRRAFVSNNCQMESPIFSKFNDPGDLVAKFIQLPTMEARLIFLKNQTENGNKLLPGMLWAKNEQDGDGKRKKSSYSVNSLKDADKVVNQYLEDNPLYSSYKTYTSGEKRFEEYLRCSGYGEYSYKLIDSVLLNVLELWCKENSQEVENLLKSMWTAMIPEKAILMTNFLRIAILERCMTLFSVHPKFFSEVFLKWTKANLVDTAVSWTEGNTTYTVKYPDTFLASMCVTAAANVNKVSGKKRDELIELGLTKFKCENSTAEFAAQLFNMEKERLHFDIPWKTCSDIYEGWQLGIVRNALEPLWNEFQKKYA